MPPLPDRPPARSTSRYDVPSARPGHAIALHLTPLEAWRSAPPDDPYVADSLAVEGYVHLTHRADDLLEVANTFYGDDPRPQVALVVDLDRLAASWRYDGDERFPHVYGPLDRGAIVGVRQVERDQHGTFLRILDQEDQAGQR